MSDSDSTVTRSSTFTRSSNLSHNNRKKRKKNERNAAPSEIDKPTDRTNKAIQAIFLGKILKMIKLLTAYFVNENFQIIKNPIHTAEKVDQLQICQFIYETNMEYQSIII